MKIKFWGKKKEEKASRTAMVISSGYPSGQVWSDRDYENFAKETYMKNVIAFRCIDMIAKAVSFVPWKIVRETENGEKETVYDHPFNSILKKANPLNSWMSLTYAFISYFCMSGNSFMERIIIDNNDKVKTIKELWVLRPDRMTINVDNKSGILKGYTYTYAGNNINYEVDRVSMQSDIFHMKSFHPLDDFWGMAITEPAANKIDTSNSMDKWNKTLTDKQGRPSLLLFFEESLSDEQFERVQKEVKENIEGAENAGRTQIIEGARDAKPYGWSPSEMDWIKSNLELTRSVCIAWGVPPQLLGIPDISTYSNYSEARTSFWEDTVIFYLDLYRNGLDAWLFPEESLNLCYVLDDIPAMQYKRDLLWDRSQKSDFLTINEKRAMVGFDEIEGGDFVLQPASMIPLGMEEETEDDIEQEEEEIRRQLLEEDFTGDQINVLMEKEKNGKHI